MDHDCNHQITRYRSSNSHALLGQLITAFDSMFRKLVVRTSTWIKHVPDRSLDCEKLQSTNVQTGHRLQVGAKAFSFFFKYGLNFIGSDLKTDYYLAADELAQPHPTRAVGSDSGGHARIGPTVQPVSEQAELQACNAHPISPRITGPSRPRSQICKAVF